MNPIKIFLLLCSLSISLDCCAESPKKIDESEVISFLSRRAPEVAKEANRLRKSDKAVFQEVIEEARTAITEYRRVKAFSEKGAKAYWEMYRVDFDAVWYSDEIAKAKDEFKEKELRIELEKIIGQSFDYWMVYEKAKLEKVRKDLEKAEAQLKEHQTKRSEIIKGDTDDLIEESRRFLEKPEKK